MCVLIVNSTTISLSICSTIVGVCAVRCESYRSDPVVDVATAFARGRTPALAEGVSSAAVAVGVAFFGGDAAFSHLFERQPNVAAVAFAAAHGCCGAPDQIFFGHVDLLGARPCAVRFRVLDCVCVRDCIRNCETPARAALSLVHNRCEAAAEFLSHILE